MSLTKEIKLIDDSHQISVKNIVRNNGNSDIYVRNYEVISRDNNSSASIMLPHIQGAHTTT